MSKEKTDKKKNKKTATNTQNKKTTKVTKQDVKKQTNKNTNEKIKSTKKKINREKQIEKKEKKSLAKRIVDINGTKKDEVKKFIKIVLAITLIMVVVYGVTMVVVKKSDEVKEEKTKEETKETTQIQYENIIIGTMLNYDDTYYVLIKEDEDNRMSEYTALISEAKASEEAPVFYYANLTDSFNKPYLGKESNYDNKESVSDFKVTGTTLVKISDHKIVDVYDNYEDIKNEINDLK